MALDSKAKQFIIAFTTSRHSKQNPAPYLSPPDKQRLPSGLPRAPRAAGAGRFGMGWGALVVNAIEWPSLD